MKIKVKDIIFQISIGELSNTNIGLSDIKSDNSKRINKIINYIKDSLIDIYTKIPIIKKDLVIEIIPGISTYYLRSEFAESSESNQPYKYIKDTSKEPFKEDVIKIIDIYDNLKTRYYINDINNGLSIYTPFPDTIEIPFLKFGSTLFISYQANYPEIDNFNVCNFNTTSDDLEEIINQELIIPKYILPLIKNFVAYKYYSHISGQENSSKAIEFYQTYNALLQELTFNDYISQGNPISNNKFRIRGFV